MRWLSMSEGLRRVASDTRSPQLYIITQLMRAWGLRISESRWRAYSRLRTTGSLFVFFTRAKLSNGQSRLSVMR